MSIKIIFGLIMFILFSCSTEKKISSAPINLVAFIKVSNLDSMSKIDFENEKTIQLNSSKFKIRYVTAYLHGGRFNAVQAIQFVGNSLNNITHIYTFINAKPPFEITFGDIKCAYYKGKAKKLIYAKEFSLKIY
jgi:hypothetical protein